MRNFSFGLLMLLTACGGYVAPGTVVAHMLTIQNETDTQVAVYAMPTEHRVATVPGFATTRVRLRELDLRYGEELTLKLRALASTSDYTTPTLLLSGDLEAVLVIRGVAFNGLESSSFYTRTP